jgi:hypothetical protein
VDRRHGAQPHLIRRRLGRRQRRAARRPSARPGDLAYFFLAAALLIDWKHRANIVRLAKGTEPKIGRKQPA